MLTYSNPEIAKKYAQEAQEVVLERFKIYQKWAEK